MNQGMTRREILLTSGVAASGSLLLGVTRTARGADNDSAEKPFGFCLNTSTIRGQKLELPAIVDIAAEAGYDAIEPWIPEIRRYAENGGNLADLRKRIEDRGLTVESAIGFARWIVDDDRQRAEGLETMRRDMDVLRQINGKRIAAPPVGATNQTDLNLFRAAERYGAVLELGQQMGVVPQVELWGFSKSLSRLGELLLVAAESGHPSACLLPDIYHIHRGGSDFHGLRLINGQVIHVFHVNDYPTDVGRETLTDADRVYPGDGGAPIQDILKTLYRSGFRGMLSLELFNRDYWKQDASVVARRGLEKMQEVVRSSMTT